MEHPYTTERTRSAEIDQLRQELEQAQVALRDAQGEIATLRAERDARWRAGTPLRTAQAEAERVVAFSCCQCMATRTAALGRAFADTASGTWPISLEEATLLVQELQRANAALTACQEGLDGLVAERTRALDQANARLEALNVALQRRIALEASARAETQAELFKLQKLEAVGQLTGGIAHDFNNLLTVIISGLQLLGQVKDAAHRDRVLRRIEDAAWRGAHLTQRLLAFARRQPLHPEWLNFVRHVDGIRELMTHALRGDIDVRTDIDPAVWPVEVDIAALELALLNLAVNARDAMPQGGTLVLSARNTRLAATEQLDLAAGDYVELAVTDTGNGMPKEVLDRVFEPFFTTKAEGKGTGLGLPQVYGFVKQSGGTVWLESAVGEGTSVHLLLPRSMRAAPPEPPASSSLTVAPQQRDRLKILVVEDDDTVAALVLDLLAELGHSGTRVGTVASALAVLTGPETVHLVFSDVLLPGGGSGLDLAREIARRQIGVPVILTSGYGGSMPQRLAASRRRFVPKPYRLETLRQAIEDALSGADAATDQDDRLAE